jgi:serine protease
MQGLSHQRKGRRGRKEWLKFLLCVLRVLRVELLDLFRIKNVILIMMRKVFALLLLLFPLVASAQQVLSDPQLEYPAPGVDNGELLIDFKNDDSPAEINRVLGSLGVKPTEYSWLSKDEKWVSVKSIFSLISSLRSRPDVEAVEPNYYATALYTPNDPYYKYQWHLDIIGMQKAWDFAPGKEVIVAVIDTGIAYEKYRDRFLAEDLGESQFVKPYNFVAGNEHANDDHGHGTHVAGTIAQLTNNGVGAAGVAPNVKLMPLKVLNSRGFGSYGAIAAAIRYAADNGAQVINMSLGGPFPSFILHKAIKYAYSKGVVIVCAAGNSARSGLSYPAAYPETISVSAVRYDRTLSWYSSYGKGLTIAAPGGDMNVDQNGDGLMDGVLQNTLNPQDPSKQGYFLFQGTSMATPHVAAAAALLISHGIEEPDKVREFLQASATKVKDGSPEKYGAGVLDVNAALQSAVVKRKFKTFSVALLIFLLLIVLVNKGRRVTEKLHFSVSYYITNSILEWPKSNLLVWSAAPALLVVLLVYPWKKVIPVGIGFACGTAGFLLYQAISPVVNLQWIPGTLLDSVWLLIHALITVVFAVIASFRLR